MTSPAAPRIEWVVCFTGRRVFQVDLTEAFDEDKVWAKVLEAHRRECSGCPHDRLWLRRLTESS